MTVLSIADLSLSFGTRKILDKISFSLNEDDKLGVIGVNGCGKSTLFKVITGELTPDEGNVFRAGDKTVGILTQDGAFEVDESLGDSPLAQMIAAFPEMLEAEARLADMEQRLALMAEHADSMVTYCKKQEGGTAYTVRCFKKLHPDGKIIFRIG